MLETWFDPAAIAIVLVGTLIATLLRCGVADSRIALGALRGLFERAFDVARAKSELALQIREIADDGFIRAEPHHFGDSEFDSLSDLIISQRSIQSLLLNAAHAAHAAASSNHGLARARAACHACIHKSSLPPPATLLPMDKMCTPGPGAEMYRSISRVQMPRPCYADAVGKVLQREQLHAGYTTAASSNVFA